jgi:hypothetical protein
LVCRRKRFRVSFVVALGLAFVDLPRLAFEGESPAFPSSSLDAEPPTSPSSLIYASCCSRMMTRISDPPSPSLTRCSDAFVLLRFPSNFLTRERDIELERSGRRERVIFRVGQRHRDRERYRINHPAARGSECYVRTETIVSSGHQ